MMLPKRLTVAVTLGLLAACGHQPLDDVGTTLADLPEANLPAADLTVSAEDLAQIEAQYRSALLVAKDPQVRHHIQVRLADLEMARSEQAQQDARTLTQFFAKPIEHYQNLVDDYAANPQTSVASAPDALYYKLAKAQALEGRTEDAGAVLDQLAVRFPDSPYLHEAQFRRAERAFAAGDYAEAEALYREVAVSPTTAFADNALYMQGWSAYKLGNYETAMGNFTQLLDQSFAAVQLPGQVATALARMDANEQNLVDDTLRVLSFTYANLDGAQSIVEHQQAIGTRPYQYLLYRQLGKLYETQERYLDSADTYARFVNNNPDADLAPDFTIMEIDVYQRGGFPSLILPAKRSFVDRYGVYSPYWQARAGIPQTTSALEAKQVVRSKKPRNMSSEALAKLKLYLNELARHHHAEAQRLQASLGAGGELAPSRADVNRAYAEAADLYQQYIVTFPADPAAGEMNFLMAEAYSESGRTLSALTAYETVAFNRRDPAYGSEAGYSSILLAQQLVEKSAAGESLELSGANQEPVQSQLWQWQMRKIENALKFAEYYPNDERAVQVLAAAAPELMYQGDLARASVVARQVITWQPVPEGPLLYSAWLTLGHAEFDQQLYAEAEGAYWRALELHRDWGDQPGSPSANELRERIAASIYQQAQQSLASGDTATAIAQLLRIDSDLPNTEIASTALFDAGHAAQTAGNWAQAEALLTRFAANYPNHELAARIPAKLIVIYEAMGAWELAAGLLSQQSGSEDTELARQSLLTAAEYYDKADNWEEARNHYRDYAHTYQEPFSDRLEVELRLSELYAEAGDESSRDFWLRRLVQSGRQTPTERSRYLGAKAAATLAEAPYSNFRNIALTLPIKTSLNRKRAALDSALAAQRQVLDFKVAEFTTQANFFIGEIYTLLARDLMASERPDGLNALELEQYDILLEEQAYPFEEKAIELHEANARRSFDGLFDDWVAASIDSLAKMLPARYGKQEVTVEAQRELH
ncbi:tetratricopeptide repeat protein [Gilvimarinus sp. SDUM040013]|uniref:Tetratricopeptide repeat protein n=1 Tax=Gilvimarinus gilvus TaxID=3058038 RepID=A0ABU4RZI4_9GAMM|nr:tetratricopeptide repeat protein [Gilvimarinus sp. SDUM040013]MDO3384619.1 tetratricopeptide repeat protein [Gilvimarinus sp. SDUM040013]MDX6850205.1 tetratricopeptide repeat protein [Gilvimarinus sp. SDUM040013]